MNPVWHFLNGVPVIPVARIGTALLSDGTAAAPALAFTSSSGTGLYYITSNQMGFTSAGYSPGPAAVFGTGAFKLGAAYTLDWSSTTAATGTADLSAGREAADHWFQKRTTNAQRASWANTYTSATNYEAFSVDWQTVANVALVGNRTAATGTFRPLRLGVQASSGSDNYILANFSHTAPFLRVDRGTNAIATVNDTSTGNWYQFGNAGVSTATSGTNAFMALLPNYNQSSGTAANTDLLVNRTQTAVGSGAQLLMDLQVGSATKFKASNTGLVQAANRMLETRSETAASTDGNMTYTAAQVLGGWITRTNMSSNRVDAFPTAADLVAGIPGAAVGHSFTVVVNNNDTAQTVTVNGASNGITYEGTATAIAAAEARLFLCILTNVTAASEAATVIQIV